MRRVAALFIALVLVLSGMLAWRLHVQAAEARAPSGGAGEIEGTEVDLASRVTARVLEQPVKKGEKVEKGALLLALDCADPEAALAEARARLAAARAQAEAAASSARASESSRAAAVASELAARAQASALGAQRDAALRQASRLEGLDSDVSLSSRDETRAGAEGLSEQTRAALAQAEASAGQVRAAAAGVRASSAQASAALAEARAAEASVARAQILVDDCRLLAPRTAVVDDLPHEVGELVGAGQVLVKLVDLAEVKATFYLPNAELAAARPGDKATVVADAWPGERFSGVVRTVSARAEFTPRNIQTRTDRDRLVYPVEVWLENPEGKLRPGMPVQVELAGARR